MEDYRETRYRSVIKALSWRVFATCATVIIVYLFTRKIVLSLGVGMIEVVVKLILYYFHEQLWTYVPLGRKKP